MSRVPSLVAILLVGGLAACSDDLTSPAPVPGPNAAISDAASGGINKDVFFLPPLVPDPRGHESFDDGEFNPNLTSAVIRVCRFEGGVCAEPVAAFGRGQTTGPITISNDHYLAVWHTEQSNPQLIPGAKYRIEVFLTADVNGPPVAWADVEVAATGKELRNIDTDQTIALLDGKTLPIRVRIENGVRCTLENCLAKRVDRSGATLILTSGNGALILQEGWLPEGVSEVTVTVQREETGPDNDCVGKTPFTGPGLIAQEEACLHVTTDPVLTPGTATGIQREAFVFLCRELQSGLDPDLEPFVRIFKADAGRPLLALADVSHATLIQQGFKPQCDEPTTEIGSASSSTLMRFASRSARSVTKLLARAFDVTPAYAIDLGQGGAIPIGDAFSFFTFGVSGELSPVGPVDMQADFGSSVNLTVELRGPVEHEDGAVATAGIPGVNVTFTVVEGDGVLSDPLVDGSADPALVLPTDVDGRRTVSLQVGEGANVVTAVVLVDGEPASDTVTFTVTGEPLIGSLRFVDQPTSTVAGETMEPPVVIELLDASGNRLTNVVARVTIGHPPDSPAGCQILQTSTLAINGLATFSNIQVNGACHGVRMGAAGGGGGYDFPIILSEPFDILPAAPAGQIAFTSDRTEDNEIYLMNVDGTGVTNLTSSPGADVGPIWSRDGSRIAFQSQRLDAGDVFRMDADGSNQVNLTAGTGAFELRPSWSPDGTKIVYLDRGVTDRLFVMNADGTGRTLLANDAGFPAWSPDGSKIAFATNRDGNAEIYVMDANGSNQVNLTNHTGFDLVPVWSPDGTQILWLTTRDGNAELYVMNADGTNPRNLTNSPASEGPGGWSPDGFFIVFDSDRDGNSEIYIMRADGSGVTRVTINPASDERPAWKP